jgi:hypothetical protein
MRDRGARDGAQDRQNGKRKATLEVTPDALSILVALALCMILWPHPCRAVLEGAPPRSREKAREAATPTAQALPMALR